MNILENLNHKKAAPPLPDRILVASYVSAGRWSQASLCYFHPQSFVLLLWIACLSDWLCVELFHTQPTTPTLHKSEVDHPQPEFCEGKTKFRYLPNSPLISSSSAKPCFIHWREHGAGVRVPLVTGQQSNWAWWRLKKKQKSHLTFSHTSSVESS